MLDDEPANHDTEDAPTDREPGVHVQTADADQRRAATTHAVSRGRMLIALTITAICVALVWFAVEFDDAAWWRVLLIAWGGALATAAVFWRRHRSNGRHAQQHGRRPNRFSTAVIAAGGALMLIGVNPPSLLEEETVPCGDPIELRVLLPEEGASGFAEAIAAFDKQHTDKTGCRVANVTTYDASWNDIEKALELGWEPQVQSTEDVESDEPSATSSAETTAEHGAFEPMRDVGPRPDLLIVESATQIELASRAPKASKALGSNRPTPIGTTPLVLAVPQDAQAALDTAKVSNPDLTLSEMIKVLSDMDEPVPVLRTNPAVSHTGILFLEALYGADATSTPETKAKENQLSAWTTSEGIPMPATNTDLLCTIFNPPKADSEQLPQTTGSAPPTPALNAAALTTEAALARYNSGADIGERCPKRGSRSGLFPYYEGGMDELDYQAVGLDWDEPMADDRAKVAEDLTQWLANGDDWKPTLIGIRNIGYTDGKIEGDIGFDREVDIEAVPLSSVEYQELQAFNGENGVDASVLVSIDHSMSMTEQNGETTRFELAAEAASTACSYLGDDDRLGLWTFPDPQGASHTEQLPFGEHECEAVADSLADSRPFKAVELHQMMIDGAEAVAAGASGDQVKAMVVLTDGVDKDDAPTVADVHAALEQTQVTLFVIAVGDVSCESGLFKDLATDPQVICLTADPNQLTSTFDHLYSRLWGDDG